MDRKLLIFAIVLFLMQSYLLIADIDVYSYFGYGKNETLRPTIGQILETRQNVKRKGPDSIVWEDSTKTDTLHIYDSVLTLEDSSARLKLSNETVIDLHENTLVLLEPSENSAFNESLSFRLKFSRGNMLAKNSDKKLDIDIEEWVVHANAGSELTLKALQDGQFEVEMHSGSAIVKSASRPSDSLDLQRGVRATFSDTDAPDIKVLSETLAFTNQNPDRVYSHDETVKRALNWTASAEKLRVIQPDKVVAEILLEENQRSIELPFRHGSYFVSLLDKNHASKELQVDIRAAPKIRYIHPRPRDRLIAGEESLFSWFPISIAKEYILHIGEDTKVSSSGPITKWKSNLDEDTYYGKLQYEVWGVDADGYLIPPDYNLPIYSVRDPFQAPRLRSPSSLPKPDTEKKQQNTKPKKQDKFSWLIHLIFPLAQAQDSTPAYEPAEKPVNRPKNPKIIFNWYAVDGADFYIIEISSQADFSFPEVMTKVSGESFKWEDYKLRTYYWRIAAGSNSGRMGLFSEALALDLTKVHMFPNGEIQKGVWVEHEKSVSTAPSQTTAEAPIPQQAEVEAEAVTPAPPEKDPPGEFSYSLNINLHHQYSSFEKGYSVDHSGFSPYSLSADFYYKKGTQRKWKGFLEWSHLNWEPKYLAATPYQKSFTTNKLTGYLLTEKTRDEYGFGLAFDTISSFKKVDDEAVAINAELILGPVLGLKITATNEITIQLVGGILTNGDFYALWSNNTIRYQLNETYYLGGDLDISIFFGPDSSSGFSNTSGLHFGREW